MKEFCQSPQKPLHIFSAPSLPLKVNTLPTFRAIISWWFFIVLSPGHNFLVSIVQSCHLKIRVMSFESLIYRFPHYVEGRLTCRVSHSLDFVDCTLMVQISVFLCAPYFLKVGSRKQRSHQSHFQALWQDCRCWCVVLPGHT